VFEAKLKMKKNLFLNTLIKQFYNTLCECTRNQSPMQANSVWPSYCG